MQQESVPGVTVRRPDIEHEGHESCVGILQQALSGGEFYTLAQQTINGMQALATLPSLRSLPVHLHREILKSDSLALYSQFGTLLTDEHREDALERHLQRFVL